MYTVTITNDSVTTLIHDDRTEDALIVGSINDEINCFSVFSFTIYPDNPGFDLINPLTSMVKVYNDKQSRYDFIGRVLTSSPAMDSSGVVYKNVDCQSRMSYLQDSVQPYQAEKQWETLQDYIDFLLENHNAQVETHKKIYAGNITLQTYLTSDGVYKGTNYQDTWSVIKEKLLNVFGGEIAVRENIGGVLYLDYAESLGVTRSTPIELGVNMQSITREEDPTGIITRLIPLGAKKKVTTTSTSENGSQTTMEKESEERLTIASVNDDCEYIIDQTAEDLYGRIYGTAIFDDVTTAVALYSKGQSFLAENNLLRANHTLSAADLSLIDQSFDDFMVGDTYPVKNDHISLDTALKIVSKTTNINSPEKSSIEMGKSTTLLSDIKNNVIAAIDSANKQLSAINTIIFNTDAELQSSLVTNFSSIQQTLNSIQASVTQQTTTMDGYLEFNRIVRNILQMDADNTTMLFQTITEQIAAAENVANTNYNEIIKFIRFVDGKIIIGIQGNPFTVEISNDRLSFKQNTTEMAYMSNNNLYIGNAIIKAGGKLQIGQFAFVPRSNGSMSLLKVGDVV